MSISIYYTATRGTPLTDSESKAIDAIIEEYSVDDQIAEREKNGFGPNWESFCVYDRDNPSGPNVVFEGATGLPDNSEEALWNGLQHWCKAISAIHRILADADWDVHVDDHELQWNKDALEYDPTS